MIHLGDITKIRGCVAPVVDVMIGGSPCQDLSRLPCEIRKPWARIHSAAQES